MSFEGIAGLAGLWRDLVISGAAIVVAVAAGLLAHVILRLILKLLARRSGEAARRSGEAARRSGEAARRSGRALMGSVVRHSRRPLRLALPVIAVMSVLPFLPLPEALREPARQLTGILLILAVAWLLIKSGDVLEDFLRRLYSIEDKDNLQARKIVTQVQVAKRVFAVVVIVLSVALALLNFERVRQLGATILASAGIIGVVLGFASQRSIALLFAGLQVAFTQPIRLDDVLIVENEWGRVEEISLTYVVIRIWDLRRLVVPTSYFIERPFQNWTRVSADLLGTVFVYADYSVPVGKLRAQLHRILQACKDWDGKVWNLQVTDAAERTVELRALMSAADASRLWDLRCEVRERLVEYLQREFPGSLARVRAEVADGRVPPESAPPQAR